MLCHFFLTVYITIDRLVPCITLKIIHFDLSFTVWTIWRL